MSRKGLAVLSMAMGFASQAFKESQEPPKKKCLSCGNDFIPRKGRTQSGQKWETQLCELCMATNKTQTGR